MKKFHRRIEALERIATNSSASKWGVLWQRAEELSKQTGQNYCASFFDAVEELKFPLTIADVDEILAAGSSQSETDAAELEQSGWPFSDVRVVKPAATT